ncbi:MAG TPA: hypothetical protein PLC76_04015 [Saprospiraceae bacterium]|nr:hypothetical protein [Saprospiraceae bacterium]HRP83865.1 hypothetical protein [Saprospiraceae bacterium]
MINFSPEYDILFYTFAHSFEMRFHITGTYLLTTILLTTLAGCSKEESSVPTYLSFGQANIIFQQNAGSNHQNIEDYWLIINGQTIAVASPDRTVPVIGNGIQEITVQPGIRVNGQRDEAQIYSFLEPYKTTVSLCACADTIHLIPEFKYKPTALFSFIEDFENSNRFSVDLDDNIATSSTTQTQTVAEGSFSLALNVDATNKINSVTTQDFYIDFESNGRDLFLEFEYKSDFTFLIGLQANTGSGNFTEYAAGAYATPTWKKMYVNFTDLALASKSTGGYRPVFTINHAGGTQGGGNLYLDNIKLVHY